MHAAFSKGLRYAQGNGPPRWCLHDVSDHPASRRGAFQPKPDGRRDPFSVADFYFNKKRFAALDGMRRFPLHRQAVKRPDRQRARERNKTDDTAQHDKQKIDAGVQGCGEYERCDEQKYPSSREDARAGAFSTHRLHDYTGALMRLMISSKTRSRSLAAEARSAPRERTKTRCPKTGAAICLTSSGVT